MTPDRIREAFVELRSLATAKDGMRFDNRYCMVLAFDGETIVRGRSYVDSALVARLFEENPIAGRCLRLKPLKGTGN